MNSSGPQLAPAFRSRASRGAFCATIGLLLALPLISPLVLAVPRAQLYLGLRWSSGPWAWTVRQIEESGGPIDVAFVGSSQLWRAIDAPLIHQALDAAAGRPTRVVLLGSNWRGEDLIYVVLRDLLARRPVRMVVLSMPNRQQVRTRPHVMAHRWLRLGEDPALLDGLPLRERASIYAAAVLGTPRQLYSLVAPRSGHVTPETARGLGSRPQLLGYHGAPFVAAVPPPPVLGLDAVRYTEDTRDQFRFSGPPLSAYERHFTRASAGLLRRHGVKVVVLHLPLLEDAGSPTVEEREDWTRTLGPDLDLVGIPPARLFPDTNLANVQSLYYDHEHFNANGSEYFTRVIASPLAELFVRSGGLD